MTASSERLFLVKREQDMNITWSPLSPSRPGRPSSPYNMAHMKRHTYVLVCILRRVHVRPELK